MKITKAIFTQKDQEYLLWYWTEQEPQQAAYYRFSDVAQWIDKNYKTDLATWQKSFKEVRIHPTQLNAFKHLAGDWYDEFSVFQSELKKGIELPDSEIYFKEICNDCNQEKAFCSQSGISKFTQYAFLVEGKKETPEVNYMHVEGTKILPCTITTSTNDLAGDNIIINPSKDQEELWISVEERLPEDDTRVLGFSPKYGINSVSFFSGEFVNAQSTTHWMPLPEPPKTK